MKIRFSTQILLAAIIACFLPVSIRAASANPARQELAADAGWKFFLGDPSGAEAPSFADASWRAVDLPHDWSIESKPDKDNPSGSGEGFFPGGIGWYRKTFHAPADWKSKRVSVEFDGVYRDATVYLNGHKLGTHPYGYTAFAFDLTPELNFSGANVLAVRVDNSAQPNSRWYSGSGIYRHVRVVVTDPTHVAHWGVFVTTPEAESASAKVAIQTRVANEASTAAAVTVETTLLDKNGKKIGNSRIKLEHRVGQGRRSGPGDRRRESRPLVAGLPYALSRRFFCSQRRQDNRPGDYNLRHTLASMVGRKWVAVKRQAGQADRGQRPSRQRASRRRGV